MKFINLLKKELSELINKQMLISLVFVLSIFLIMGNVMQSATNEIVNDAKNPKINVCNMDNSDITKEMLEYFNSNGSKVNFVAADENDLSAPFKNQKKLKSYVVIPKGFGETVENGKKPEILSVNKVQSISTFSGMTGGTEGTISLINGFVALYTDDDLSGHGVLVNSVEVLAYLYQFGVKDTFHQVLFGNCFHVVKATVTLHFVEAHQE